jgi:hypothetical protein
MSKPDYSASMSQAVGAALASRRDSLDHAHSIAALLLSRFNAMPHGDEGPDDDDVIAALEVIVEKLQRGREGLTDSVRLENDGLALLRQREVANG